MISSLYVLQVEMFVYPSRKDEIDIWYKQIRVVLPFHLGGLHVFD